MRRKNQVERPGARTRESRTIKWEDQRPEQQGREGRQVLKDRAHNLLKPEHNPSVTVRRVN